MEIEFLKDDLPTLNDKKNNTSIASYNTDQILDTAFITTELTIPYNFLDIIEKSVWKNVYKRSRIENDHIYQSHYLTLNDNLWQAANLWTPNELDSNNKLMVDFLLLLGKNHNNVKNILFKDYQTTAEEYGGIKAEISYLFGDDLIKDLDVLLTYDCLVKGTLNDNVANIKILKEKIANLSDYQTWKKVKLVYFNYFMSIGVLKIKDHNSRYNFFSMLQNINKFDFNNDISPIQPWSKVKAKLTEIVENMNSDDLYSESYKKIVSSFINHIEVQGEDTIEKRYEKYIAYIGLKKYVDNYNLINKTIKDNQKLGLKNKVVKLTTISLIFLTSILVLVFGILVSKTGFKANWILLIVDLGFIAITSLSIYILIKFNKKLAELPRILISKNHNAINKSLCNSYICENCGNLFNEFTSKIQSILEDARLFKKNNKLTTKGDK
ncbi:hypothetical protein GE118_00065 [Mycoplasma sp. NEAQ87857]|uniref:hypothetical protein n=1 Tax=Mycoplasma sp. NEAQ87857 TaxID=2683967 RepID=UPI001318BABF|nr:hypothetical protein [Mycoplasma sp. NEAQ87857]QGZ97197.1 hypothetical protein GE118_00065 [Mycoplasma sp. NEAQ87857]